MRSLVVIGLLFVAFPALLNAQDEDALRLMNEPASYTDVADAFDGDDLFDLNVHIGFVRERETALIRREANTAGNQLVEIGDYEHIQNRLELGLDIGVFQDLALYFRLPLVLSDTRSIQARSSRPSDVVNADLCVAEPGAASGACTAATPDGTGPGNYLFTLPSTSTTRSGLDYLGFELAYSIFNQHRKPHLPTWVLMVEGRFGIGEQLRACVEEGGTRRCNGGTSTGISRGMHALRIESRASRRFRYAEPYGGLSFQIEWPKSGNNSLGPGNIDGLLNDLPPRIAEFTAGVLFVPWEHRGQWQRFSVDVRGTAQYVSEGHDYSPLFDALGTSGSTYLTLPNVDGIPNDQFPDFEPREVDFTGLTDVQAHGRFGGRLALEMQAARYVRFSFGAGLYYTTPHLLTFADACNPTISTVANDPRQGRCRVGIINPHHRAVIDVPGQRFRQEGMFTYDLFLNAAVQF